MPARRAIRWCAPVAAALVGLFAHLGGEAVAADPCAGIGWLEIAADGAPIRHVSSLAGGGPSDRVYAGSRQGTAGLHLYSGVPAATGWVAETVPAGLAVTDALVTPGRPTEVWVSTFGTDPPYDGPVLGRDADGDLAPRGALRSWFMALAATGDDVFVAATKPGDIGVHRWVQADERWALVGGQAIDAEVLHDMGAGADGRLWLATGGNGLWASSDGGATWLPRGDETLAVWAVAVAPDAPDVVLMGLGPPDGAPEPPSNRRGLAVSRDGGQTWLLSLHPRLSGSDIVPAIAFSVREPGRVFASGFSAGLFESRDYGASWAPLPAPSGSPRYFEALLTVPVSEGCELLYAGSQSGLYVRNLRARPSAVFLPAAVRSASLRP